MRSVPFLAIFLLLLLAPSVPAIAATPVAEASGLAAEDDSDAEFDAEFDDEFADGTDVEEQPLIADPLEGWNRGVFWCNDKFYFYLFKPLARGYRVVPEPVRESVGNFFSNLSTPVRAVNALLQFKLADSGRELSRLLINSTLGLGGLFDPAKSWWQLEKKEEDFGQTLGRYGVGSGWYLVLPILGPSSLRDGVGLAADSLLDPWRYPDLEFWEYAGIKSFDRLNVLSLDPDTYEGIKRDALDPYLFIRAAYAQHRLAKIKK